MNLTAYKIFFFFTLLLSTSTINAKSVVNYLLIDDELRFNQESYKLKWSSHPSDNYYKQEYLRKEDKLPNFRKMLLIETIKGNFTVNLVADFKVQKLEKLKLENPIINYERNDDKESNETIIDFIISDGKSIDEWNIYRYKLQKFKNNKYIVLFAYSLRSYSKNENDATKFYTYLKENRSKLINEFKKFQVPKIKIK
jgi:hypothetical protein